MFAVGVKSYDDVMVGVFESVFDGVDVSLFVWVFENCCVGCCFCCGIIGAVVVDDDDFIGVVFECFEKGDDAFCFVVCGKYRGYVGGVIVCCHDT